MNISRFFGATNREALRQVRLALGPDALILSNKRVNGGVEILATDETAVAASAAAPQGVRASSPSRAAPPSRPATGRAAPPAAVSERGAAPDVLGAIGDLKGALETRIDELLWGNQLRRSPQAVVLFQTLLRAGFSTALLRAMLKRLPEGLSERAAFQWAHNELVTHLPVLAAEDQLWKPGVVLALVGPTGVGKTTTIAKLAARCVRRVGPENLVLITTDTYRIGAHEQLKIYGQMLHVPVHVVQDVHELKRVVQTARPEQTILVDNVGISQRDRYIHEQAALLAGAGRQVERLLVLNASSHGDTLDEVARSYSGDGGTPLRGCIISKVDEAPCLGAALDTALRYQLPIHYVSNGQKVPENLLFLSAQELVDRALAPAQRAHTLYAPTQADLAAMMAVAPEPDDANQAARRRREQVLLPTLLSATADGAPLALDDLRAAVTQQDEDVLLSEAYALWRQRAAGQLPGAAQALAHLRRVVVGEQDSAQPMMVLHVRQRIAPTTGGGTWSSASWFGGQGAPLAAGPQQIVRADGWYAADGARAMRPTASQVLHRAIGQSETGLSERPWHVFASASQTALRELEQQQTRWISVCGARTRVDQAGEMIVLAALARTLQFQPLPMETLQCLPVQRRPDGVSWWVGHGRAELRARGHAPLSVRVVCVRAVDEATGAVRAAHHALVTPSGELDAELVARAVLLRQEMQGVGRQSQALLDARQSAATGPLIDRAMLAAQLGLAAWHLVGGADLAPAAGVVARMLGRDHLTNAQASAGLFKLFALKELLAA